MGLLCGVISVVSNIDSYIVFCHSTKADVQYLLPMAGFPMGIINDPNNLSEIRSVALKVYNGERERKVISPM